MAEEYLSPTVHQQRVCIPEEDLPWVVGEITALINIPTMAQNHHQVDTVRAPASTPEKTDGHQIMKPLLLVQVKMSSIAILISIIHGDIMNMGKSPMREWVMG